MEQIHILYLGRHEEIATTVLRLVNSREHWKGMVAVSPDEAFSLFCTWHFDVVLLGPGLSEQEEAALRKSFQQQDASVPVLQHYGGGSGLLFGAVLEALAKGRR